MLTPLPRDLLRLVGCENWRPGIGSLPSEQEIPRYERRGYGPQKISMPKQTALSKRCVAVIDR
jgi:hypothetical protein